MSQCPHMLRKSVVAECYDPGPPANFIESSNSSQSYLAVFILIKFVYSARAK